jgi:O-antigen ligase
MAVARQSLATLRGPGRVGWPLVATGVVLALIVGWLAAQGHDRTTFVVAVALPLVILLFRYPWTAVLVYVVLEPLFAVGGGTAVAGPASGPETWLIERLLVPVMLLVALAYRMLGLSRSYFRLSLTDVAIAGFLVLAFVNVQLLTGNPVREMANFYVKLFIPIALYWLIRVIEPRERELEWLLWAFIGLVLLQAAVGALSWVAPSVLPAEWLGRAGERTVGTVRGPGPYTATLMVGAMMAVAFLEVRRSELARLGLFAVIATAFIGIAISFSRGSWLGAAAVVLGLLAFRRGVATRLGGIFGIVLIVLVVASGGAIATIAATRFADADTAESRLVTNNAAIRMIQLRPALGFGYDNFELFDESLKVRVGNMPAQEGSAHHSFLALAAENGIPALILYLFPVAWLLWLTLRRWRQVTSRDPLHGALLIAMWLAIGHEFVVMNFMDMLHSSTWGTSLWWLCLGVIHVVLTRGSRPEEVVRVGWTVPAPLRP